MLIANEKPIVVIGYPESVMTQEVVRFIECENRTTAIMMPNDFLTLESKDQYQYMVGFTLDAELRKVVIEQIDDLQLDCITYVDETCHVWTKDIASIVGPGTIIMPFSLVALDAYVGRHCILEGHICIGHRSHIGNNVVIHLNAMVAGSVRVDDNCVLNMRSNVLPKVTICNDVELGAISSATKDITTPGLYLGYIARRAGDRKIFRIEE